MAQKKVNYPLVGVIMGSTSDWETMREACEVLDELNVSYEKRVVSAHRTPEWMSAYATQAEERGLQIIIAGAGGAAHLPGMVAAQTPASCNRRSGKIFHSKRAGFAVVNRANAARCSGWDGCYRRCRCTQCRTAGSTNSRKIMTLNYASV